MTNILSRRKIAPDKVLNLVSIHSGSNGIECENHEPPGKYCFFRKFCNFIYAYMDYNKTLRLRTDMI